MKQRVKALLIILLIPIVGVTTMAFFKQQPQANKELTVTLTLQDWNVVVFAITNPDDITANQKKDINQKIVTQLNKQLADTTKKK